MRSVALLLLAAAGSAAAVFILPDLLGQGLVSGDIDASGLATGAGLGALGIAWMGGVLTSLTPCVYPLIPITMGVIGARQAGSRLQSLGLTTAYVFGMALMFSGLGFAAASSGKAFGTILANRWVVAGLALFFTAMAASMFGAFQIAVPQGIATRLNRVGGAGYGGAIAMGLVAGIVAAPCTGPVLASLLTFVAGSGQPLFGLVLLFVYALGVGLPFFLMGAFSISLPRSGAWMEGVKSVFGVALLAMALLYLRDAFPALRLSLGDMGLAFGSLAVGAGVLVGGIHRSFDGGTSDKALKTLGVTLAVVGIFVRVGGVSAAPGDIRWLSDHEEAMTLAKSEGMPVMIDFYADWCAACKELDRFTFSDGAVAEEAERFVTLKVDGTVEDDAILALYERYQVQGLPTVVFITPDGKVMDDPKVTGFVDAPRFLDLMKKVP